MNDASLGDRYRERMVRKILRHSEVHGFGSMDDSSPTLFVGVADQQVTARDNAGKFERRSKELRYLVSEHTSPCSDWSPEDHVVADPLVNGEVHPAAPLPGSIGAKMRRGSCSNRAHFECAQRLESTPGISRAYCDAP